MDKGAFGVVDLGLIVISGLACSSYFRFVPFELVISVACFKVDGGSNAENLGLQNIQARIRMVVAFMVASLTPWVHSESRFYLVLGSSNVDEGLRGYLTKYDCSAAYINPIGSISKTDIRSFLKWAANHLGYASLEETEAAPPTAELDPIRLDEVDMGMTYEELSVYGRLRKIFRCGPVSMFKNLCFKWGSTLTPSEIGEKVKYFFILSFLSLKRVHKELPRRIWAVMKTKIINKT